MLELTIGVVLGVVTSLFVAIVLTSEPDAPIPSRAPEPAPLIIVTEEPDGLTA